MYLRRSARHRRRPADARLVGLSPGRTRHLFVQQTGLPFRTYLLWLRRVRAVELFAGGAPLTDAAHGAGFSDSAHLSRTFRRMFGIAAASLRLSRPSLAERIHLHVEPASAPARQEDERRPSARIPVASATAGRRAKNSNVVFTTERPGLAGEADGTTLSIAELAELRLPLPPSRII